MLGRFMEPEGLRGLTEQYGPVLYAILFALFLFQTGFLVGPVVPGNPIVFVAGVVANPKNGALSPAMVVLSLALGAFAGNLLNYGQGRAAGPAFRHRPRWASAVARAEAFIEKRGRVAALLAPLVPFIRAFVPFVAGMGRMPVGLFAGLALAGCLLWIGAWTALGYFLGDFPFIQENVSKIVIGIVLLVSVVAVAKALRMRGSGTT